jgi:uncharacterized protein (TIGR04255 family)
MNDNPLIGSPPTEVPLPNAPLVRVIAQVRFPIIASVEKRDFIAPFQEAIRADYPVMRQDASNTLVNVGGQGQIEVRSSAVWRFHDREHRWRVTLAADFLALESSAYTSRGDFFGRFEKLMVALADHVQPGALDRLGVRYIDRLTDEAFDDLAAFIQPALLGALGTVLCRYAKLAVSDNLFGLPDEGGQMRARWGILPENTTIDPDTIEAVNKPSWVLDLDAFVQGERAFAPEEVAKDATRLAERCYAFFLWSVTDRFLAHFGGKP